MSNTPSQIQLIQPDDWHLHIRDGEVMKDVLADTARQFARAIIMPNLVPPVVTLADALAYRDRILAQGGRRDAADLVEDFLGRPFGFDSFATWLEE